MTCGTARIEPVSCTAVPVIRTVRSPISKVEEIALRMSLESHISDAKIAEHTRIRPRTMSGLRKRFRATAVRGF
jgi:hypothetical protein